ncbi:hypothetical protein [Mucilaginibacter sp.]|uniref:hypothetical protein n=1 Tax=Mucilaginibacter sp. TaxID=1882438 RepID=UPI0035BBE1E5
MKKPALLVIGLLLLAFISIYFIIPQNISAESVVHIDATDRNVAKFVVLKSSWKKWWPGEKTANDSINYSYKNVKYSLLKSSNGDIQIKIKKGNDTLSSKINYLATGEGETDVAWTATQLSSTNPFTRIAQYTKIKAIQTDMAEVLATFKKFMQIDENVYGLKVAIKKVTQHYYLTTSINTTAYPATETVYKLLNDLQKQVTAKGAKTTGNPILNVNQTDDRAFSVMVALPVNKNFAADVNTKINEMVVGANLLQTQVTGGRQTIANAFTQLKLYQKDHVLTSPAMPFESLITNRLAEKDTAKWVTTIYYPIF